VKYASRQELYPELNVCESLVARVTCVGCNARDVATRDIVLASRAVVFGVVIRDTIVREGVVAVRDIIVLVLLSGVRDTAVASLRIVTFCDCFDVMFRPLEFVVRTAASVTPMHTKHAVRKDRTFLILSIIIMITKNTVLGQVVFTRKNKKSRFRSGMFCYAVGVSVPPRFRSTNVMRPLSKSYGVISTRTCSPTLTQMRALRIFPHTVAKISCPFSSFTRNMVLGNLSSTTPLNTITSSFAIFYPNVFCIDFLVKNMILREQKNCKIFLMCLHGGRLFDKIKCNNM